VGLGSALDEKHLYSDAIPNYEKAIRLRQDDARVHVNLAVDSGHVHRTNEATRRASLRLSAHQSTLRQDDERENM